MTEVMFHLNVADRLRYACRLLRKAQALGAQVVVTAPAPTLARLDSLLWSFEARDFVPHVRVSDRKTIASRLQATPVWLVEHVDDVAHREALLNLGDDLVPGFESFARLIEVVPDDEQAKQAARQRWRHYADRGYALKRHEVAQ
ncbi:MAG: DNA polymerase III subunit chi [Burkholderiaceae bacterium]|nr:DNA polymerase III subunit chi [Burkholderiaceae bacterium]